MAHRFDRNRNRRLEVDRQWQNNRNPPKETPAPRLSLFLDASVAELICDSRHAITTRIYRKPNAP